MDTGAPTWTEIIDDVSQDRELAARRLCPYCGSVLGLEEAACPDCGELADTSGDHAPTHERYFAEALARWEEGDLPATSESLRLCLRLHPAYVPALRLAARLAARRGDWRQAAEQVGRAARLAPRDPATQALSSAIAEAAGAQGPALSVEAPSISVSSQEPHLDAPRTHKVCMHHEPDAAAPEGWRLRAAMALAGGVAGAGLVELLRRLFPRRT